MKTPEQLLASCSCLDCKAGTGSPSDPHEQMREVCVGCFNLALEQYGDERAAHAAGRIAGLREAAEVCLNKTVMVRNGRVSTAEDCHDAITARIKALAADHKLVEAIEVKKKK